MKNNKIIAVDFDGTLCKNNYPEIGEPNRELIEYLKQRQKDGAKLILWSCRVDKPLEEAIRWSRNQGLIFDAVNENLSEIITEFGKDTRKIFANEYIDDRNIWIPEKEYDTQVCNSVRRNPYKFVDILRKSAETSKDCYLLLEAACLIANLLKTHDISESEKEDTSDEKPGMLSWAENEVRLACKRERGDKPEDE